MKILREILLQSTAVFGVSFIAVIFVMNEAGATDYSFSKKPYYLTNPQIISAIGTSGEKCKEYEKIIMRSSDATGCQIQPGPIKGYMVNCEPKQICRVDDKPCNEKNVILIYQEKMLSYQKAMKLAVTITSHQEYGVKCSIQPL